MQPALKLLVRISNFFCGDPDLARATDFILDIFQAEMCFTRCMINLYDSKREKIFVHKSRGLTDEEERRGIYAPGEGITGQAVEEARVIAVPRIGDEPTFLNRTRLVSGDVDPDISFICVPIIYRHKVLGTLSGEKYYADPALLQDEVDAIAVLAGLIAQDMEIYIIEHVEKASLVRENEELRDRLNKHFHPGNMIGASKPMAEIYALIERIARTQTSVLILGESGVGKELVASAVHYHSGRSAGPFIRFSCAALPESLIESELFGHEKGAFTGAAGQRRGRFEEAHLGTIFLDEVGELSPSLQAKLLRVLQERVIERVGGNKPVPVDIRVIAATNRDLERMVREGAFREDLYYRLNVFPIVIPPLRERGSDIIELADFFVKKYSDRTGRTVRRISTPALEMLMSYHWPGNVRELENVIERAVILTDDDVIHGHMLPPSLQTARHSGTVFSGSIASRVNALEYEMIVEALKDTAGNVSEAAGRLGVTRRILAARMKKFNLDFHAYRVHSAFPAVDKRPAFQRPAGGVRPQA
jgi:Nif-specific regulatory protein